jgi:hypothetical protein
VRVGVGRVAVERAFVALAGPLRVVERVEAERPAAVARERGVRSGLDRAVVALASALQVVERPPQQVPEVDERRRERRVAVKRPPVPLAGAVRAPSGSSNCSARSRPRPWGGRGSPGSRSVARANDRRAVSGFASRRR